MRGKLKIHAIAISIICLVIVILYVLVGPKEVAPVQQDTQGDRAIEIYSATWGEACNPFIDDAIRQRNSKPAEKDENGTLKPQPKLERVTANNVLTALSSQCNGRISCNVSATSTMLGTEPLASCFKRLKFSYRCFSFDRLWIVELGQGESKAIDCNASTEPAKK